MEVGGKDVELGMEGRRKGDCRHIGEDGLYEGEREKDVMSEPLSAWCKKLVAQLMWYGTKAKSNGSGKHCQHPSSHHSPNDDVVDDCWPSLSLILGQCPNSTTSSHSTTPFQSGYLSLRAETSLGRSKTAEKGNRSSGSVISETPPSWPGWPRKAGRIGIREVRRARWIVLA